METTKVEVLALGISREAVEGLSDALAEPYWMRDRRLRSWEVYERTPMPTTQDEEWRRTDLRKLKLDSFRLLTEAPGTYEPEGSSDHRSGFAQVVDGYVTQLELDPSVAEQGVIFSTLTEAAKNRPELVQKYLGTLVPDEYGKFAALANALSSGLFLYVPTNVQVELPIQVSHTITRGGAAVFPRTLIVGERFASATLIERYYSEDFEEDSLSVGTVEVFAGESTQLRYVNIQEWCRNVWHFLAERHSVGRDAQENNLNIALGAKQAKANVDAVLVGPGASCEMLGLFFPDRDQHYDHHTLQDHAAPNCFSDLLYKGVLRDTSRSVFSGLINVHPGAQKTDAYQTNRNLLLSDSARADSIPNLEIQANDVRCSHGASVGPIDTEQLFYLMARGLSRTEAERMIVDGFFEPLVNRIPLEGVRERLVEAIDRKMS